jgi:hypothetical protein
MNIEVLCSLTVVVVSISDWVQIRVQCASSVFSMRSNLSALAADMALLKIYLVYVRLRYALRIAGANLGIRSTSLLSTEVNPKLNSREIHATAR